MIDIHSVNVINSCLLNAPYFVVKQPSGLGKITVIMDGANSNNKNINKMKTERKKSIINAAILTSPLPVARQTGDKWLGTNE